MPMNAQKRPADQSLVAVPQLAKRTRNDEIQTYKDKQLAEIGVKRYSNLFSPIMKLEGHESDIFTCEFHPDGEYLGKYSLRVRSRSEFNFSFPLQHRQASTGKSSCGQSTTRSVRTCR